MLQVMPVVRKRTRVKAPRAALRLAEASEATKGRFYFQLAAGLTSELEVTLGLRTPEEVPKCGASREAGTLSLLRSFHARQLWAATFSGLRRLATPSWHRTQLRLLHSYHQRSEIGMML